MADGDNQTIWCESYEKSQKVKDGRNSTSSLPIIDSISAAATTTTSDFSTQPSGIDLFADIESVEDDDVEVILIDRNRKFCSAQLRLDRL